MRISEKISPFFAGTLIGVIGAIVIFFLLMYNGCGGGSTSHGIELANAANDSIRYYKDAYGRQTAETKVIMASNKELKAISANKNKELAELKKLVSKKTISATVASVKSNDSGSSAVTITKVDTFYRDSVVELYPTYSSNWDEKWSAGRIVANKDSVVRDISTYSFLSFSQHYKRDKWYKSKYPVVTVSTENPRDTIVGLKSYAAKPKKGRFIRASIPSFIAGVLLSIFTINAVR